MINHIMYTNNTKGFSLNEKELKSLKQTIRIYSQDIGMEFGNEKCAMLIMKSGKRKTAEEIEQSNLERIWWLGEKENYKFFGILEADTIKQAEMKKKNTSEEQGNFLKPNFVIEISS